MSEDPPSRPHAGARDQWSARAIEIDLAVEADGWRDRIPDLESAVSKAIDVATECPDVNTRLPQGRTLQVGVVLADDALLRRLNRQYRGVDAPTNVLSFPAAGPEAPAPHLLGDIVLALETVIREAEANGKTARGHFVHLLLHGLLHLAGFDHQCDADAEVMESLEVKLLAALGIADPYTFSPQGASLDGAA